MGARFRASICPSKAMFAPNELALMSSTKLKIPQHRPLNWSCQLYCAAQLTKPVHSSTFEALQTLQYSNSVELFARCLQGLNCRNSYVIDKQWLSLQET